MPASLESVLSNINQMTHYHLQESVDKAFLFSIFELLPIKEASIINIYQGAELKLIESKKLIKRKGLEQTLNLYSPNRLVLEDNYIRTCLKKHETCTRHVDGMALTHIPIIMNDTAMIMLRIVGDELIDKDYDLLHHICLTYRNHSSVIYENEHDTLTKLLNRKTFDNKLAYVLEHYASSLRNADHFVDELTNRRSVPEDNIKPFWLGLFDIDHFKHVNDTYGHLYGDEVLLLVSQLMRESFRVNDMLFRYGGEEFIVILDQTNEKNAYKIFERFRERVANYSFPKIDQITISIGIAQADPNELPRTIVDHADQALYYAKHHGRNQSHCYNQLVAESKIQQITAEDDIELF